MPHAKANDDHPLHDTSGTASNARTARPRATAVCVASHEGPANVVRFLASLGADVEKPNNDGITPAAVESQNGHEAVVRYLTDSRPASA